MKQWTPAEIRKFRKARGLYQRELAALIRVSNHYIYLLEKGLKTPSGTIRALLDCLEREAK